jgi:pyruvate dehydrogenase E1 component alpha subunit
MPVANVADWMRGHGLHVRTVDGNDVELVHAAAREAVATIRATGRPYLLELSTYRTRGHFEPDDQAYVDAGELAAWKGRDPVRLMTQRLLDEGVLAQGELAQLHQRVADTVAAALAFAEGSPWPDPRELERFVYA